MACSDMRNVLFSYDKKLEYHQQMSLDAKMRNGKMNASYILCHFGQLKEKFHVHVLFWYRWNFTLSHCVCLVAELLWSSNHMTLYVWLEYPKCFNFLTNIMMEIFIYDYNLEHHYLIGTREYYHCKVLVTGHKSHDALTILAFLDLFWFWTNNCIYAACLSLKRCIKRS